MNTENDSSYQELFDKQKKQSFLQRKTTAAQRIAILEKLKKALPSVEKQLIAALAKDLAKPAFETHYMELQGLLAVIDSTTRDLNGWMQVEKRTASIDKHATVEIRSESRGVVLIIGPWNVPFTLVIEPMIAALAAGNTVILKPSEMTPATSRVIAEFIPTVFPAELVSVAEGGVNETTELLKLPFDHIFFTGSPNVGKVVMGAAAKNLTTVTLELGGKSPFILDETADLDKAAHSLLHKKTINGGQICIAPDYLLIKKEQEAPLLDALKKADKEMYFSTGAFNGKDISRVINKKNYDRLKSLFEDAVQLGATVAMGGVFNDETLQIQPTVLTNVSKASKIMHEEIFGPILPVLQYKTTDEAIDYVNAGSKPLALYIFSSKKENVEAIVSRTSSGGVTVNEAMLHVFDGSIPFGGINGSGMGAYHGVYGFRELSHQKSIYYAGSGALDHSLYPPFKTKMDQVYKAQPALAEA